MQRLIALVLGSLLGRLAWLNLQLIDEENSRPERLFNDGDSRLCLGALGLLVAGDDFQLHGRSFVQGNSGSFELLKALSMVNCDCASMQAAE